MATKHRAYAERNELGYWVGCIERPNGAKSRVTNAKDHEWAALEIAERMAGYADERDERERQNKEFRRTHRLGRILPGKAIQEEA